MRDALDRWVTSTFEGVIVSAALGATASATGAAAVARYFPHHAWLGSYVLLPIAAVLVALTFVGRRLWGFATRLVYTWRVAKWSGITRVYAVQGYPGAAPAAFAPAQREAARQGLRQLVAQETSVKMLFASGFPYLGGGAHPGLLDEDLARRRRGFVLEVLLLDPDCPEAETRARAWKMTPDAYREGIRAVLWTLRRWKRERGYKVDVRVYRESPIWQMVITDRELWLLCARGIPADASPVYCIDRQASFSLAFGLLGVWDRRWASAAPVNLETLQEPDFDRLENLAQP